MGGGAWGVGQRGQCPPPPAAKPGEGAISGAKGKE